MASGSFSADGNTDWYLVNSNDDVHIAAVNDFGSGTINLQQRISGTARPVRDRDNADAAITFTDDFDDVYQFKSGDVIRLNLSGSTSPDIDWIISGPVERTT